MNGGNSWIDLPIIQAIEYFQGIMAWFISFAKNYGLVLGTIGLAWTGFRLVNARIGVREMLWDTIYKWMIYLLLVSSYPILTFGIQKVANEVGLVAGDSKSVIKSNFEDLHKKISQDIDEYKKWSEDFEKDISDIVGIPLFLQPLTKERDKLDWTLDTFGSIEKDLHTYFSSKKDRKEIENKIADYIDTLTFPSEKTIYSERTLKVLNAILIRRGPDGEPTSDLTNSYIDLDLWLKDKDEQETNTFSCASLFRIGLLCGQIMWEQSQLNLRQYQGDVNSGEIKNSDGKKMKGWEKFEAKTMAEISTVIMAGIGFIVILFSVAFAIIQYAMCSIEFAIIQGIGAFFIPFYLFDGTKDIPKKLVPVFTGLFIKIIVMVICLMFIVRLWLDFAVDLINPANGGVSWATLATVIFTGMLSFVLTSNAPKIAMTLLTGQPQLSMEEFVAAAGTMIGGAMLARNVGKTVGSPLDNAVNVKMGEAHQRHQASSAAKKEWDKTHSSDIQALQDLKPGKNASKEERANYKNLVNEQKSARNFAGQAASKAVRDQQRENYMNNGGILGTANRMIAHYTGAAQDFITNPKSYVMGPRQGYQSPNGMHDFINVAEKASESAKNAPPPQVTPDDEQNKTTNVKNKKPLEDDLGVGTRNA